MLDIDILLFQYLATFGYHVVVYNLVLTTENSSVSRILSVITSLSDELLATFEI